MSDLIVYSPQDNKRLQYVLDYLIVQRCGLAYELTDKKESIGNSPLINYSSETLSGSLTLSYSLYLQNLTDAPDFEKDLSFSSESSNFDLLAAIFFLLARVEEYDNEDLDEHGRYKAENSVLCKKGLLAYPLIDAWVLSFKEAIQNQFSLQAQHESFEVISTIDVDHIYAFKHKSTFVRVGSLLRDMLSFQFSKVRARWLEQDPYDRLEDMLSWHTELDISPIFFVLTAQRSTYDKSLAPTSIPFISKISSLSTQAEIGIHPSYASNVSEHILKKEKNDLAVIINKPISQSRQHYLKLAFPETYRRLINQGIESDYTLGYAGQLGFRAGTSRPFYWYDLENDEPTSLRLIPFSVMDVTLKNYLSLSPEEAEEQIKPIIKSLRAYNGCFCLIWHNSSFYELNGWKGWEAFYRSLLKQL